MFQEVHRELAECRARDDAKAIKLSELRTEVVALYKMLSGEWPPIIPTTPAQAARLEQSPPRADGGGAGPSHAA